jgi:hypothetical protein
MARPKVYPRHRIGDKEFILLHQEDSIGKIDIDSVKEDDEIKRAMMLFDLYSEKAKEWFWIETGVQLVLYPTKRGYKWCVEDNRDNAGDYRWLSNKAKRFERKIIERVNQVMLGEAPNVIPKCGR